MKYLNYDKLEVLQRPYKAGDQIYLRNYNRGFDRDNSCYRAPYFTKAAIVDVVHYTEEESPMGQCMDMWIVDNEGRMRFYEVPYTTARTYEVWDEATEQHYSIIPVTEKNTYMMLKWSMEEEQHKLADLEDISSQLLKTDYDAIENIDPALRDEYIKLTLMIIDRACLTKSR